MWPRKTNIRIITWCIDHILCSVIYIKDGSWRHKLETKSVIINLFLFRYLKFDILTTIQSRQNLPSNKNISETWFCFPALSGQNTLLKMQCTYQTCFKSITCFGGLFAWNSIFGTHILRAEILFHILSFSRWCPLARWIRTFSTIRWFDGPATRV